MFARFISPTPDRVSDPVGRQVRDEIPRSSLFFSLKHSIV